MTRLRVRRDAAGNLVVDGVSPPLVHVLREMPALLGADQPDVVKKRLFPDPSDDEAVAAEWRRTQREEITRQRRPDLWARRKLAKVNEEK